MYNFLAMVLQTLYSTKKTFYYNFFPTKAEENSFRYTAGMANGRKLIEMRDIYPPPVVDFENPWLIKKTLTHYETAFGKLVLSYNDTFEHVIRYWTLGMANFIALGQRVGVTLWDVTEEKNPKRYHQNSEFYLQMMANDECLLSCMELIRDRKLKVDDEIYLYWDSTENCFKFKLFS